MTLALGSRPALRDQTVCLADFLRRSFVGAVLAADPGQAVARLAQSAEQRNLIIAVGKAARQMASGALERLRGSNVYGLCVVPDGCPVTGLEPLEVICASHPLPDSRSLRAAERALALARTLDRGDRLLALISGGASSLMAAPPRGKSLDEKVELLQSLIHSGLPIRSLNLVRRHLSAIKGGRLACAAPAGQISTLVVGDVIGGSARDIGSGLTVPGGGDAETVREILRRVCPLHAPRWLACVEEPPMRRSAEAEDTVGFVGGPEWVAADLASRLSPVLATEVLPAEEGDVHTIAARRVAQAWALAQGRALVIPCEPTVRLPERTGTGGRAGLVAWLAARELPTDAVLLCGATDGVDGSSGAAGAVVTRYAVRSVPGASVDRAIARFDDGPLHHAAGTDIRFGPSPTNVSDLHVVARCGRRAPP